MSRVLLLSLLATFAATPAVLWPREPAAPAAAGMVAPPEQAFLCRHCIDCHDGSDRATTFRLDALLGEDLAGHTDAWEQIVRKLELRAMPPAGSPRPDEASLRDVLSSLTTRLEALAEAAPNPGRTETFRRLTRAEYQNAVRDLLGVEIDAAALLPADESSHGFDNITVAGLSPTLLTRYIAAAEQVSRLSVARPPQAPTAEIVRVRPDLTQDVHLEGLPLGTRGGLRVAHHFPVTGEYEVQVRLMRDRNDNVESLKEPHTLVVLVDRAQVDEFTVAPSRGANDQEVDRHLRSRFVVDAGRHEVGVTFLAKGASLLETPRQPLNVHFNFYRHPRLGPAIYEVSIVGPLPAAAPGPEEPQGPSGAGLLDEDLARVRSQLAELLRRALRRPITDDDLRSPLEFFREAHAEGGFDAGLEAALTSILVHPQFLFRIEREPAGLPASTPYPISDIELATRLSFFLWSSLPDEELLASAEAGRLHQPEELRQQTLRLLADPRSRSLVENFASQWLYLRNLEAANPDMRLYPDFDDNLRQAFFRETGLALQRVIQHDRSVLELIRTDQTFLNERLARHYGIPHVHGSHFRLVKAPADVPRGGLLRHGSILTVSSYATRTSPVLRGKWILENLLASPPPPPPENVPPLTDNTVAASLSIREQLAEHRAHEACAACHDRIDPIGLALEQFDAIGRWRAVEDGRPVDATGGLFPDQAVAGVAELEAALLEHPEIFVRALAEKLLTYALGRGLNPSDAPALRRIVREVRQNDDRFSSLILGIVTSSPFQWRLTAP